MNLLKVIPFLLFLLSQSAWATSVFAGDDCVKCGMELPLTDNSELSALQKSMICLPYQRGLVESARGTGIELFGSFENYYGNMHRIDCGNSPTPIYHMVDYQIDSGEFNNLIGDLRKLDKKVTARLLNKVRKGRRKETVLDLFDRTLKEMTSLGHHNNVRSLTVLRDRFVDLGAKKRSELTPEELALYEQ
jgi:hypothetical protein